MLVYDRLLMELSNQQYLSEDQYRQLLIEEGLNPNNEYDKQTMCKGLWLTCIDVLEAVCNDVDLMSGVSTEFSNIGQAYEFMEARIVNLKDKIASIPDEDEEYNAFSLMYTRGGIKTKGSYIDGINSDVIDNLK